VLDRINGRPDNGVVSAEEIEAYLNELDEPAQGTLRVLRASILAVIPECEECISYRMPAFRVDGKVIAGFAAFKTHVSYLPHSGSVFPELKAEVAPFTHSTGALQFAPDTPLPDTLVKKLIEVRLAQAFPTG
jgi:uncharacterized protein YdhG (YjbR/CyaY superfamily)